MRDRATKVQRQIGDAMRVERTALGLSQEELAHDAGLSRNYYGCIERGEKMPSALTVIQVASALQITTEEFFRRAKL